MKGLLLKDIIQIKNNFQFSYLFFLMLGILPAIGNPEYMMVISVMVSSMFISSQIMVSLNLDEISNWNRTVLSLPVTLTEIVFSKYVLLFLFTCLGIIIAVMLELISVIIYKTTFTDVYVYIVQSIIYTSVFSFLTIPISFKLGTGATKYLIMAFIGIPVLAAYIVKLLNIDTYYILEKVFLTPKYVVVLLSIFIYFLLLFTSLHFSKKWYRNNL